MRQNILLFFILPLLFVSFITLLLNSFHNLITIDKINKLNSDLLTISEIENLFNEARSTVGICIEGDIEKAEKILQENKIKTFNIFQNIKSLYYISLEKIEIIKNEELALLENITTLFDYYYKRKNIARMSFDELEELRKKNKFLLARISVAYASLTEEFNKIKNNIKTKMEQIKNESQKFNKIVKIGFLLFSILVISISILFGIKIRDQQKIFVTQTYEILKKLSEKTLTFSHYITDIKLKNLFHNIVREMGFFIRNIMELYKKFDDFEITKNQIFNKIELNFKDKSKKCNELLNNLNTIKIEFEKLKSNLKKLSFTVNEINSNLFDNIKPKIDHVVKYVNGIEEYVEYITKYNVQPNLEKTIKEIIELLNLSFSLLMDLNKNLDKLFKDANNIKKQVSSFKIDEEIMKEPIYLKGIEDLPAKTAFK